MVAGSNNLYCAGYIESSTVNTANEIVGAEFELEQIFSRKATIFISVWAQIPA